MKCAQWSQIDPPTPTLKAKYSRRESQLHSHFRGRPILIFVVRYRMIGPLAPAYWGNLLQILLFLTHFFPLSCLFIWYLRIVGLVVWWLLFIRWSTRHGRRIVYIWVGSESLATLLTSGFSWAVHSYFDRSLICRHLRWICENCYCQVETFSCNREKSFSEKP